MAEVRQAKKWGIKYIKSKELTMNRSGRLEKDMGTGTKPRMAHENHDKLSQTRQTDHDFCTINCNLYKFESLSVNATVSNLEKRIHPRNICSISKKRHD